MPIPSMAYNTSRTDGDGFGVEEQSIMACEAPANHATQAGDCDDSNKNVNPDATEVCDDTETDDDCDGKVNLFDESIDASTINEYYPDNDRDGYGDATSDVTLECTDPSTASQRYVTNNNDCDDTTDLAKPGGVEVCDGIDNDCDASTREDGMVLSVDRSGGRLDKTETFAGGSPSNSIEYRAIGEETLYFCAGDHYARIITEYSMDLVGLEGSTRTTLSAASRGSVVTVKGDGLTVSVNGLSIEGGQASKIDSVFTAKGGGGILCQGLSELSITESYLANNRAEDLGGAIHVEDCNVDIVDSEIRDNRANSAAGISVMGGDLALTNSVVARNAATGVAGGLYIQDNTASGDAVRVATLRMSDSEVYQNSAFVGGGITLAGDSATASCEAGAGTYGIYENDADNLGGGLLIFGGTYTSTNCDYGSDASFYDYTQTRCMRPRECV